MNHGDHEMPAATAMPGCKMNMLWNTQIEDTCIVFRTWHVRTNTAFFFSCIAVVFLGVLYEYLRLAQRNLDVKIAATLSAQGKGKSRVSDYRDEDGEEAEEEGLLTGLRLKERSGTRVPIVARLSRAFLYGLSVFLSFFLMLVFMTYNAYLILATVVGAALGHYVFTPTMDVEAVLAGSGVNGKGMACH